MRVRRSDVASPRRAAGLGEPLESWTAGEGSTRVAVLVHDGVTTADIVVPGQVLAEALQARVHLVGATHGPLVGVEPSRPVIVSATYDELPDPDVVLVPGGIGWRAQAQDEAGLAWLRRACPSAAGVLGVSTGSLLLAAAGLLEGRDAAGHWLGRTSLADLGAHPVDDRTQASADGRWVTTSGALAAAAAATDLADLVRYGPPAVEDSAPTGQNS